MTTTNATTARRNAKAIVCGIACALSVAGTLAVATPSKAYAATTTTSTTQKAAAKHYNGESVVIKTKGATVYAEWYKIGKEWKSVFKTDNGTKVYGVPSGSDWKLSAVTKKGLVPIMRTQYESTKVGKLGPKGLSSHWRALTANVWY